MKALVLVALLLLSACADLNKFMPLQPYDPTKERKSVF